MAPSRKSRSVNKRFSTVNEVNSSKDGENSNKSRHRKRRLSDMLGPQWSKDELERFYKAYRKHGKDWEKVASAVRSRSVDMVEALYSMNKAYLSLPKGYASSAGLIAMMTDHYSNLGDSDSDHEIHEGTKASQKPQKRIRQTNTLDTPPVPDLLNSHLSIWKERTHGRPWAVGKRTPRVPVSHSYDKGNGEKYISPTRQVLKQKVGAFDDDVAHEIALALTEASQKGGSPQISRTPNRKRGTLSSVWNRGQLHTESEMTSAKLRSGEMDEGDCELSLGSTEAEVGNYARDKSSLSGKRCRVSKPEVEGSLDNQLDDIKEACSGTEEGQKMGPGKGKLKMEVSKMKHARASNKGTRKRSKKVLFGEGGDDAFDALQTLADLSLRPEIPADTDSSGDIADEKMEIIAKSKLKGNPSASGVKISSFKTIKQGNAFPHVFSTIADAKEGTPRKRRQKAFPSKISENEEHTDSHLGESQKVEAADDINNFVDKVKCAHDAEYPKQGKVIKPSECTSSSTDRGMESNDLVSIPPTAQVIAANRFCSPTRVRSKRKINTPKSFIERERNTSKNIVNSRSKVIIPSVTERALSHEEKLFNFLSSYQVRRWCVFEWFYSAIDYPWFAKREFAEYLDHVGLGHVPRLTRVEWGVIRSSLGKPRRFSEQFLKEEMEKLNQYRESVRKHYAELRAGTRDGLPTDLARPLSVGQRIIALHPRTREIQNGSVLTVDHDRCRVQFDKHELGVELVMDVDCMPLNPLENMPASLTSLNVAFNKFIDDFVDLKMNGQPIERKIEGYIKFGPCEDLENTNSILHTSPSTYNVSNLLKQEKGISASSNTHIGLGLGEGVNAKLTANSQTSILAHIQAKEADIQALSELTRALDKKEAVVSELKRMNDEVYENQKDRENSLTEPFKKHYASVLLQLNEVNEQVTSALFFLRQRNTYQGNNTLAWMRSMAGRDDPDGDFSASDHSLKEIETLESGSHVAEIVESSRTKAQTMVDVAIQAMSSLKREGSNIESIEEAIDFVNNQLSLDDLSTPAMKSSTPANSVHVMASHDQLSASTENVGTVNHSPDAKLDNLSDQNEAKIPSELIAQCVATLLMIQKCTERQFPPSDVARVLDSAVTNLKPCCSQNLPIYADIQKCMGIIRNQILALIPT